VTGGFESVVAAWLGQPGARVTAVKSILADEGDTEHGFSERFEVSIEYTDADGDQRVRYVEDANSLADLWRFLTQAWPEDQS
jgi:hypothetical protein